MIRHSFNSFIPITFSFVTSMMNYSFSSLKGSKMLTLSKNMLVNTDTLMDTHT